MNQFTESINSKLYTVQGLETFEKLQAEAETLSENYLPVSTIFNALRADINAEGKLVIYCMDEPFTLTDWALSQLCQLIHVPKSYLKNCYDASCRKLLLENINTWFCHYYKKEITLLTYQDKIHGFVSRRYLRIPHKEVLRHIQKTVSLDNTAIFKSYTQSPEYLHLRFIDKEPFMEDHTGSPLFFGYFIQNSEVGCSSLILNSFIYRKVCTNGLMLPQITNRFIKRHIGSGFDISHIQTHIQYINADNYRQEAAAAISQSEQSVIECSRVQKILETQKIPDSALIELPVKVRDNASYYNLFDIVNVITDHAKKEPLEKRLKAEVYAGEIMQKYTKRLTVC